MAGRCGRLLDVRLLLKKLSISAVTLVVAGAAAELVARAAEPGPFSLIDRNPYVESEVDGHHRHRAGFVGRWDSTWYEIDERGFRGPVREVTGAEGEFRVACVGDSCTFGKGSSRPTPGRGSWRGCCASARPRPSCSTSGSTAETVRSTSRISSSTSRTSGPTSSRSGTTSTISRTRCVPSTRRSSSSAARAGSCPSGCATRWGASRSIDSRARAYYDLNRARDIAVSEATARAVAAVPVDDAVWDRERGHLTGIRDLAAEYGAPVVVFLFPYESQVLIDDHDRGPIERLAAECSALDLPFFDLAEEFRAAAGEQGLLRRCS